MTKNKDVKFLLREICKYRKCKICPDDLKLKCYCTYTQNSNNEKECKCQCIESEDK